MRAALFGSLGVARPPNLPRHMIRYGTPGRLTGIAGTFLAVPAGNHLDIHVANIAPATLVIPFTGAEVGLAAFIARINLVRAAFFQRGGFVAQASAGQLQLEAFYKGGMAGISILGSTSAAVLVSLGVGVGQLNRPATGWGLGTNKQYKAALMFFGGRRLEIAEVLQPANQHGVVTMIGPRAHLHMVDRQWTAFGSETGNEMPSDDTHFVPLHQPIP